MSQVKPDIETFAKIKVVGVGGGGGNAVSRMVESKIKGVEFIAINTDAQDLHNSAPKTKIHIGKSTTKGLGAGMNPEVGRQAAEESREEIQEALKGADLVFVTCGMGGGTGTGASPIIAEIAKNIGALTVGVVTKPFSFEGAQRAKIAEEGIKNLKERVDALVTIPNDKIFNVIDHNVSIMGSFAMVDEILKQAVQGISDLITMPGVINVDFSDIKAIMQEAGSALMGIGVASGENRAIEAAKAAINSPLLEVSIEGAKGVLFSVSGGQDMGMMEVNEAAKVISEYIDPNAKIIFGAIIDSRLKKGDIKVTVIATGFEKDTKTSGAQEEEILTKKLFSNQTQDVSGTDGGDAFMSSDTDSLKEGIISVRRNNASQSKKENEKDDLNEEKNQAKSIKNLFSPAKDEEKEDDDSEWDIPAFMRRKK